MSDLELKRFNFSEKLEMQTEYERFVRAKSLEVNMELNPLNVFTFIAFLESKGYYVLQRKR